MSKKNLRVFLIAGFLTLVVLYYCILVLGTKPEDVEKELVHALETVTTGQFQSQSFKVSYFPTLTAEFGDASIQIKKSPEVNLKAEKLTIRFGLFGFLLGKADVASVDLQEASTEVKVPSGISFQSLHIENMRVRARMLHSFKRIQFQWEGDLQGVPKSFDGKGILSMEDPSKRDWNRISINADFFLKNFPLNILKTEFFEKQHIEIKEGLLNGQYHFRKETGDPWVYISGHSQMLKLVYESRHESNRLVIPPTDLDLELEAGWQPLDDQILIKKSLVNTPFGKIQMSGVMLAGSHEFKEARLTLSDLTMETLPQFYLPFREAVPFNLGFSGKSELEMSFEGALDHLSFHGNWDLTPTFLNYSGFFSKPKDIPCTLSFDLLLKNSQTLAGDFSLKVLDAGFKGSLTDFNLLSGEGNLNVLSNKFLLERWASLLPAFSGYQLNGEIKVLANFSGSLIQHPHTVKSMVNVILEKGQLSKEDAALKNVYFSFDYSPLSFEIKEGQVQAGDYPVFFNATVFDPKTQPHAKINVHSDKADLTRLSASLSALGQKFLPKEMTGFLEKMTPVLRAVVPEGKTLNKFQSEIEVKGKDILVNKLKGELYEGALDIKGKITPDNPVSVFDGTFQIDHMSLARFFEKTPETPKLMNGNLFAKVDFQGKTLDPEHWQEKFVSKGLVSVTNGEFNSFSVLKTVAGIPGLSMIAGQASESTAFDDFQAEFQIIDGKLKTDKVSLLSREIKAVGDGEISLDGILNYRFDAYLSTTLVNDVLGILNNSEGGNDYLGPIPMLLSGEWDHPELKTDPSRIAEFTESFSKKKSQKVLRSFLPEDVFFKRPSKS